jgi:uncharacterized membrane protein YdcZ (DUF606 family)
MHHDELSGNPMKKLRASSTLIASALMGSAAFAHDGHGLASAHWHATDAWGWLAVAVVVAAAIWAARRK